MNDVIKVLKERRSVRKFKGDMPPKDLVDEVFFKGAKIADLAPTTT